MDLKKYIGRKRLLYVVEGTGYVIILAILSFYLTTDRNMIENGKTTLLFTIHGLFQAVSTLVMAIIAMLSIKHITKHA